MTQQFAEEVALLRASAANHHFFSESYERLQGQYPDQYVAILNGRVLVHGPVMESLLRTIRAEDQDRVLIEYVAEPDAGFAP